MLDHVTIGVSHFDRALVDRFYASGLAAGGRGNGRPGLMRYLWDGADEQKRVIATRWALGGVKGQNPSPCSAIQGSSNTMIFAGVLVTDQPSGAFMPEAIATNWWWST